MASSHGGEPSLAARLSRYNDAELAAAVALVQLAQSTHGVQGSDVGDDEKSSDDNEPSNQAKAQQPLFTSPRPDAFSLARSINDAHPESLLARYMLHEIEAQNSTKEKFKNISIKLETYHGIKYSAWYIESYWNRHCRGGTGIEERTGERAGGRNSMSSRNDYRTKRAYRHEREEEMWLAMHQKRRDAAKSRLYDAFRAAGLLS